MASEEIGKVQKFLYASGFSEPFREKLIDAATGDMRSRTLAAWRADCKREWEAIYAQRGDPMGYVRAAREVYMWGKDAEKFDASVGSPREADGREYDRRVARLYTGIFQHLRDIEGLPAGQMCGEPDLGWWRFPPGEEGDDDREEFCEFRRFCAKRQSSDVKDRACAENESLWWCAPPMHFEFAAAITIAVVRFVLFACTFSFVGLPSYEPRNATQETETPESVPRAKVARTEPHRAHVDYRVASCKGVLNAQALKFLVRILRSDHKHKQAVFQYITGIDVRTVPLGVSVRPATQALHIDQAAKLVHWCAGHKLKPNGSEAKVTVEVYAGDALLLSATHGGSRVVLARTKYKTNERNEVCVVHVESTEKPLAVDASVRALVVEALRNGRLGLFSNYTGRLFPLHYSSKGSYGSVESAEDLVEVAQ